MMEADQIPAVERRWFHTLPANTSILYPIQAGITDFGEPSLLEERIPGPSVAISAIAAGAGNAIQITTSAPHNLTGTPEVFISDVLGVPLANGRWFATVIDASNLLLNGSIFDGAYVSGGSVTTATDRFTEVRLCSTLSDRDPDSKLLEVQWIGDAYQFIGATQALQLRITYFSSGNAPTTGSLVYDDIKNPLMYRVAALCAYKHGRGQGEAERLDIEARGENKDGQDGMYYTFLQKKVRQQQQTPLRRPVRPPAHLEDIYYPW